MAKKKRARKKFSRLRFGDDSPLPLELRRRLEQIDMNEVREVFENSAGRGMTDEEHALVMATTMTLAEAHLHLQGSDDGVFEISLPEVVPLLTPRKSPSA